MALAQRIERIEVRGVRIRDLRVDLTINRGRGDATLERVDARATTSLIVRQ